MSTRESIDREVASLPEELQRKVYDFAIRLKRNARDEAFNGAELSESVLALDWNSPEEDAAWSNL
jgi:adenylyl- and sulfurtransferase ThiI